TLLADPHADHDRRADELEVLAQAALDEAPVAVLEESAGEDHEARRAGARLRREQDAGLLPPAQRRRVRGDELAEEGVQATGGETSVPGAQRLLERGHELLGVAARRGGDVHARGPGDVGEVPLDLPLERL